MGSPSFVVERPPVLPLPELGWARVVPSPVALTQPAPPKPAAILLAEDERDILEFYIWFLSKKGYKVHPAVDGIQAVELARAARPDIALLNNMMPNMSGIQACAQIRAMRALDGLPIVVYSGCSLQHFAIPALEAGASACWETPISPEEFVRRLAEVLAGRGRKCEPWDRRR